jgi:hypothetical protein
MNSQDTATNYATRTETRNDPHPDTQIGNEPADENLPTAGQPGPQLFNIVGQESR